ncbi:MAG TPA: hypothetical protein VFF73_04665 [Planctomycetota bacterium]|nr:hypothetical protein [Planctomycetota bacterium]
MNCERHFELGVSDRLDEEARKECAQHESECAECRSTRAAVAAYDEVMQNPDRHPRVSAEKEREEVAAIFARAKAPGVSKPRPALPRIFVLAGAAAAIFVGGLLLGRQVISPRPELGLPLGGGSECLKAAEAELALGERDRAREHLRQVAKDPGATPSDVAKAAELLKRLE